MPTATPERHQPSWSFSNLRSSAALAAAIALVSCGGTPPAAPPAQAPPDPKQAAAVARADALIEDMRKREANLKKSDAAFQQSQRAGGNTPGAAAAPAVTKPPTPPTSRQPAGPSAVDVVSSNYTVAERGQAFWRFSWRTSVRNLQRTAIRVRVEMVFRDAKGASISTGEQTLTINAGAVSEVTGNVSMKATDGPRVTSATPRIVLLK